MVNYVTPVTKGDVIRIAPEAGPDRLMVVAHVEHHIITLTDLPGAPSELCEREEWCGSPVTRTYVRINGPHGDETVRTCDEHPMGEGPGYGWVRQP